MILERIDPVFRTTTPIGYMNGEHGGTGFYFNHKNKTYLITNTHVIDPEECRDGEFYIWRRKPSDPCSAKRCAINADGAVHPEGEDISAILIDEEYTELGGHEDVESPTAHLAFSSNHFPPENPMIIGDITLFGYPEKFYDKKSSFPTKQEITVATPYGINFQNNPYFLTYGQTYGGTSGGPVILFTSSGWWTVSGTESKPDRRRYLIGIHFEEYTPHSDAPLEKIKKVTENGDQDLYDFQYSFNKSLYPGTILETLQEL